ncbi:magnesium transporter [Bacterioplanoides pacificum]|uniref:Magnesium transporter n=1 Tax=Bacterioplanoides pacificum TaxID=1171596 RepID=A0ABV7VWP1_9GAMM
MSWSADINLDGLLQELLQSDLTELSAQNFRELSARDKAQLLESLPQNIRLNLWPLIEEDQLWEVINCLQVVTVEHIVRALDDGARLAIQRYATPQYLASYAQALPKDMIDNILLDQDDTSSEELQQALAFDDDQVGRFMQKNFLRVRHGISVASVIRRLKKKESIAAVFLVDDGRHLIGYIPVSALFNSSDDALVETLARPIAALEADHHIRDVALTYHFEEGLSYCPVVDDGRVIGALSVSLLLSEAQSHLVHSAPSESPVVEEDLFAPVFSAARPRALWLCINLATAFLASWVIGWFEGALQQVVALAILMPVVASMGGIAGSQTLAVTVRGLALGHVHQMNIRLLFSKEMKVAVLNGLLVGLLIAAVVYWWFNSFAIAAIIWSAIVVNSLAAAASGTYIPFVLEKINIDPAVASAVILTTVTDVIGFLIFLGLGSLILI